MASYRTEAFDKLFDKLRPEIRALANAAYEDFKVDRRRVKYESRGTYKGRDIFSARVDGNWRVMGYEDGGNIYWTWIGEHDEYDRLWKRFKK